MHILTNKSITPTEKHLEKSLRSKTAAKQQSNVQMADGAKKYQVLYNSNKTLGEHFAQFFFLS